MEDDSKEGLEQRLVELEKELEERKGSIPIHSVRPHQLIEIEELEDEIEDLKRKIAAIE